MQRSRKSLLKTKRFEVVEHVVTRTDGHEATCLAVEHAGSVVILPLVDNEHVCLIRSRRLTIDKTLIELPAGTREPNEEPIETARRELIEETAYRAGHLEPLASFYTSPGILSERMHAFVASDLTPGEPQREANEEIENLVVTWGQALAMVDRGEIEDGKTLVTLLEYDRRKRTHC